ncbi:MAG: DUF3575 domain-containing protein, partial [Mediterranea sp.]|nr:DUF3575 domain-containing protein [Mediterranea sp.]
YNNIDSIRITAAASPIASTVYNQWLSKRRAEAIKAYILKGHPQIPHACIHTSAIGVDWEGFRLLVENDPKVPSRQEIIDLVNRGLSSDETLQQLWKVEDKSTYDYLLQNIFDQLQYTTLRILLKDGTWIHTAKGSPLRTLIYQEDTLHCTCTIHHNTIHDTLWHTARDTIRYVVHDTVWHTVRDTIRYYDTVTRPPAEPTGKPLLSHPQSHWQWFVKSNLLYDMALLPNLGIEARFAPRWSVVVEGYWSWWQTRQPNYWSHRIQVVGLELRHRLGASAERVPLAGHHLGLYVMYGTYDLRLFTHSLQGMGYLSNSSYSSGLTYSYIFAMGRRLGLELGLGIGYWGGTYYEYNRSLCTDCYPQRARKQRHYIGPTRAAVSLIYQVR